MSSSVNKVRWGDTLDEDDSLPPNSVVGPDKQGIQTITDYKRNDKGEVVKTVTKVRISKVERKCYAVRSCFQNFFLTAAAHKAMQRI
jgi:translation initiation factor 3 subunit G